jgi:hypothetical protein
LHRDTPRLDRSGHLCKCHAMKLPLPRAACKAAFVLAAAGCIFQHTARAAWEMDNTTLGWRMGTNTLWRFSFDPAKGKPFFHPVTAGAGFSFTNFKPEDHPWHYGLWFSWKYINHVNYWEEDRATGHAEGSTQWAAPQIETNFDGSAVIHLDLKYINPSNRVEMTENRVLKIFPPDTTGGYMIDWSAHFTAGEAGAILDRTPMPGEPKGAVNGGYGGLGLRMPSAPFTMSVITDHGPVTQFESDRARPNAAAVACNFSEGTSRFGGIAIFSDPKNAGTNATWYLINSEKMRFACPSILAPKIITLAPGEKMDFHYRIAIRPLGWTSEALSNPSW